GVEVVEHALELFRPLHGAQQKRGDALDGDVDEDAQRAEPEARGGKQLRVLGLADPQDRTLGGDKGDSHDLRGESPKLCSGAVGAGRGRAADRLPVDVAHVLEGEAVRAEKRRQLIQVGAGPEGHAPERRVDREESIEAGEVELHAGRHGDSGEAVARTDRLDRQTALACEVHGGGDLLDARRFRDELRAHALGAAPVAPGLARDDPPSVTSIAHRNALPSPLYVFTVSTMRSPSTSANSLRCSLSSPALVWRNHTLSPTRSRAALSPVTGVCTSPAISRGTILRPSGQTASGSRSRAGGPDAVQPPPCSAAIRGVGLRTTESAKAAAGAGLKRV